MIDNKTQSDNITNDPYALTQDSMARGVQKCSRLEKHKIKNQKAFKMRVSSHQKAYISDLNSD